MIQSIKDRDVYYRSESKKGKERPREAYIPMSRGIKVEDDIGGHTGLSYTFVITGDNEVSHLLLDWRGDSG